MLPPINTAPGGPGYHYSVFVTLPSCREADEAHNNRFGMVKDLGRRKLGRCRTYKASGVS